MAVNLWGQRPSCKDRTRGRWQGRGGPKHLKDGKLQNGFRVKGEELGEEAGVR